MQLGQVDLQSFPSSPSALCPFPCFYLPFSLNALSLPTITTGNGWIHTAFTIMGSISFTSGGHSMWIDIVIHFVIFQPTSIESTILSAKRLDLYIYMYKTFAGTLTFISEQLVGMQQFWVLNCSNWQFAKFRFVDWTFEKPLKIHNIYIDNILFSERTKKLPEVETPDAPCIGQRRFCLVPTHPQEFCSCGISPSNPELVLA